VSTTAPRHRMRVPQAAAIWTLVFLIGLTGGELLRQQALDDPTPAATSSPIEPTTAATPAPSANAVAPSVTPTTTTTAPPPTTTTVECHASSCPDDRGKEESRTEDGKGRRHGKDDKGQVDGRGGKSGAG
jgi:hypothetical protein